MNKVYAVAVLALLPFAANAQQPSFDQQVDAGSAQVTATIGAWGPALKNLNATVGKLTADNAALTAERDRMKAEIERRATDAAPKP